MKSVMNSTKIRKKLNELKSTFITMKEDEPQKIDIKKRSLLKAPIRLQTNPSSKRDVFEEGFIF